jgi:hypothetical protein
MPCRLAAVVVGVTANLILSCGEPVRQSPARGAAEGNANTRATLIASLDGRNAPHRETRTTGCLSVEMRDLRRPPDESQFSLKDLLQGAPDLINPRPWPGDAMMVVKPDPTIDYKIRIVKPDPSIDYKIRVVGPPPAKPTPGLRERLREMLPQQPGPKPQKRER